MKIAKDISQTFKGPVLPHLGLLLRICAV
uniref:Uncharacterized protein n=1 Tax=Rhizophora mucronata TaxID=61149 RepID=A0A2P2PSM7_RHIMU